MKRWLCGITVALLASGCLADEAVDAWLGPGICETQVCDFGVFVWFGHTSRLDPRGSFHGTYTVGDDSVPFACDETGMGAGDRFACMAHGVRILDVARDRPVAPHLSVEFPDAKMAIDGPLDVMYLDNCDGACVGGNAGAIVEVVAPMPWACEPSSDSTNCDEQACRAAHESCGMELPWAPDYAHCEAATGEAVTDWSHCENRCRALGTSPQLGCIEAFVDPCAAGDAAVVEEMRLACTCDAAPGVEAGCVDACVAARRACDEACPADSMGACLDCSAGCADELLACAAACAG